MSQITEPRDTGGPAFPTTDPNYEQRYAGEGMTLRDYFAAKALPMATKWEEERPTGSYSTTMVPTYAGIAARAYLMADAMLAERAKP